MEDNGSKYQVFVVNSAKYMTLTTTKFDRRKKWEKSDPREVRSIIPGSVIDVFVTPGQQVKEGDILLTLDAMKMYTQVAMPFDGVIKEVNIAKGDKIPKNCVMITIE